MKYRIKNEKIRKTLETLLTPYSIQEQISAEMKTDGCYVRFKYFGQNTVTTLCDIWVKKSEVEEISEYKPNEWNPYPQVKPPEYREEYLVTNRYGDMWVTTWFRDHQEYHFDQTVIAFRALPEPYKGKENV